MRGAAKRERHRLRRERTESQIAEKPAKASGAGELGGLLAQVPCPDAGEPEEGEEVEDEDEVGEGPFGFFGFFFGGGGGGRREVEEGRVRESSRRRKEEREGEKKCEIVKKRPFFSLLSTHLVLACAALAASPT